jgi:hypothetical protein
LENCSVSFEFPNPKRQSKTYYQLNYAIRVNGYGGHCRLS